MHRTCSVAEDVAVASTIIGRSSTTNFFTSHARSLQKSGGWIRRNMRHKQIKKRNKKSRLFLLRPAAAAQKGSQSSRGGLQKSKSAGFTCATAGM
jgi:hypothetical protein